MSFKTATIAVMVAAATGYIVGRCEGNSIGVTAAEYRNALSSNERLTQNNRHLESEVARLQKLSADTAAEINRRQTTLKKIEDDIQAKGKALDERATANPEWSNQRVPDDISGILRTKADHKDR